MRYWTAKKVVGDPCVGIGVAAYLCGSERLCSALECLVASFRAQTYTKWRMLITHDGPADIEASKTLDAVAKSDHRVQFLTTAERKQQFGHSHRQQALVTLGRTCSWLMSTNADNYYAPTFVEWLLSAAATAKPAPALIAYCDCIHSHQLWKLMITQPRRRHLDMGGFIVAAELAMRIPFDKVSFAADGDWIDRLARAAGKRIAKVHATLYVHN